MKHLVQFSTGLASAEVARRLVAEHGAASGMGIGRAQTLSYGSANTKEAMTRSGSMVAAAAAGGSYEFSEDDRDATRGPQS